MNTILPYVLYNNIILFYIRETGKQTSNTALTVYKIRSTVAPVISVSVVVLPANDAEHDNSVVLLPIIQTQYKRYYGANIVESFHVR